MLLLLPKKHIMIFLRLIFFKNILSDYPFESFTQPTLLNISPVFAASVKLVFVPDKESLLYCFPIKSDDYTTFSGQSSVHYQLREPISGIFALLPVIADNINKDNAEKAITNLESVYHQSYKLLRGINNISLCVKIMSGSMPSVDFIDLSSILQSLADGIKTVEKNVSISANIADNVFINANDAMISNALLNFVANSISYKSDQAVKITIDLSVKGSNAILSYSDNSIGIKSEFLSKIFHPYFSVDPFDGNTNEPSLGLGLFIAKSAFDQAGANIVTYSEFGKGINYMISIPLSHSTRQALESTSADFLLNRYSDLFIQLCDSCTLPSIN